MGGDGRARAEQRGGAGPSIPHRGEAEGERREPEPEGSNTDGRAGERGGHGADAVGPVR